MRHSYTHPTAPSLPRFLSPTLLRCLVSAALCLGLCALLPPSYAFAAQGAPGETMLDGSFLGSMLFGTPYEGIGSVDIIVLVLLGYLTARLLNGRRNSSDDDRFNPGGRSDSTLGFPDRDADAHDAHRQNRDPLAPPPDRSVRGDADRPGNRPDDRPGNRPDDRTDNWQDTGPGSKSPPNTPSDNAWTRKLGGLGQHSSGASRPVRTRPTTVQENAAAMWGALSGTPVEEELPAVAPGVQLPRGFDVKDFLEGARVLYSKLQTSWASRELEGLIPFTTPEMMLLLQKQAAKNPEPSTVDIVLVNAELEKFLQENGQDTATVLFHVTMRFGENAAPEVIDEIWHFVRASSGDGMWRLAGIDAA